MNNRRLIMIFLDSKGNKHNFSVTNIKENLNKNDVKVLMDTLIKFNIFKTKSGYDLTKKYSAALVDREITTLDIQY